MAIREIRTMGDEVLTKVCKEVKMMTPRTAILIEDKFPILIAEKTGPHFAIGDTCYSWSEENRVYNPNGKEIVAKDNSVSILRKEDVSKAYFNCHTDITIPYDELGEISVVMADGTRIPILLDGKFVLAGTEVLNEAFDEM